MHVSAVHQGSEPVVNQEKSNDKLPPCVPCQESDTGSLSSPRVVLDLMVLSIFISKDTSLMYLQLTDFKLHIQLICLRIYN